MGKLSCQVSGRVRVSCGYNQVSFVGGVRYITMAPGALNPTIVILVVRNIMQVHVTAVINPEAGVGICLVITAAAVCIVIVAEIAKHIAVRGVTKVGVRPLKDIGICGGSALTVTAVAALAANDAGICPGAQIFTYAAGLTGQTIYHVI